jgi:hypothetical protein
MAYKLKINLTPRPEFASELYRPSDRRLSANLVPIFSYRKCYVISVKDPYGRILGFLDRRNMAHDHIKSRGTRSRKYKMDLQVRISRVYGLRPSPIARDSK